MSDVLPSFESHPYAAFLGAVEKPARYTGGEVGAVIKDWAGVEAKVCLAFPDVYDIGMSHLGFKILYKILNDDPRTLAERCYAPWTDMERELRARSLPLISLESARPLRDFDVIGFSLQFELTYSNILTMLDLGGIPLRSVDRGESDPLIIAGGPTATHPEPVAPFIDAVVIGDGEEKATQVALTWTRLRAAGVPRRDRLIALAKLGAVYVPSLYARAVDADTGLEVVTGPLVPGLPQRVDRALVDINQYPFPDDGPIGGPEAIFDRMSIEIARGCTEGCRFCQAGMIYRPVRERDPEQIVATVVNAVKRSGHDEVSLTALSTADVSCISPLIKKVVDKLAPERVSLGVSSLRAYGLEPDLLDDLRRVRATGLTFAPEAGTQRMRDVVNKNVTEEQLMETAANVFSRGWGKMKLYFMIGLPTEEDADVRGIAETGARAAAIGRKVAHGRADVTVSVSTHVPKPHTPFQWAAMDTLAEVDRKHQILRDTVRPHKAVKLKTHAATASVLEGIFARGDRPLADVLERAWRNGARFDSWDERLRLDLWEEAFQHFGIDRAKYLGTIPVTARLPWSHIDVGLEDGFLAKEYRKSLQSRLSPPCGKALGAFVHHTNVEDAESDHRRLVCYDCGVACDMTMMRDERIDFLTRIDARKRLPVYKAPNEKAPNEAPATSPGVAAKTAIAEPLVSTDVTDAISPNAASDVPEPAITMGSTSPYDEADVTELDAPSPAAGLEIAAFLASDEAAQKRAKVAATAAPKGLGGFRYRVRFEKTGPVALLGHLDLVREIPRVFRRAGMEMVYTKGFHPKPDMIFAPALSLGVMSLDEYVDVRLKADLDPPAVAALLGEMNRLSPRGLGFSGAVQLGAGETAVTKVIAGARYLLAFARSAIEGDAEAFLGERCRAVMAEASIPFRREVSGVGKILDVRAFLLDLAVGGEAARRDLRRAGLAGDLVTVEAGVAILGSGAVKSSEVAAVVIGDGTAPPHRAIRVQLFGQIAGERFSPLDLRRRQEAPAPFGLQAVAE